MKEKFKIIIYIFSLFLIVGCGSVNLQESDNKQNQESIKEYSLVSAPERLVFKNGNKYEIVFYENEKIVKVETAIKFETAAEAESYYKQESFGNYSINCRYIYNVFIQEELTSYWEDYKDLDKEELEAYYLKAEFILNN